MFRKTLFLQALRFYLDKTDHKLIAMFLLQEDSPDRPSAAANCGFNLLLVSFSVKNLSESTFPVRLNCIIDHALVSCAHKSVLWKVLLKASHCSARVLMAALFSCLPLLSLTSNPKFCCPRWAGLSRPQQPAGAACAAPLMMWPGNHSSKPWLSSLLALKNIRMTSPPQPGPKCNSTEAEN